MSVASNEQVLKDRAELLARRLDIYIADGIDAGKNLTYDHIIALILPVLKQTHDEAKS